jgi:hypothetical protein
VISEMSGADVGCEFRLYFASVSSQPLTVRNKKMSRVFVAAAALFGVPENGALPETRGKPGYLPVDSCAVSVGNYPPFRVQRFSHL